MLLRYLVTEWYPGETLTFVPLSQYLNIILMFKNLIYLIYQKYIFFNGLNLTLSSTLQNLHHDW